MFICRFSSNLRFHIISSVFLIPFAAWTLKTKPSPFQISLFLCLVFVFFSLFFSRTISYRILLRLYLHYLSLEMEHNQVFFRYFITV